MNTRDESNPRTTQVPIINNGLSIHVTCDNVRIYLINLFNPKAPVGNSSAYLNIRKLTAGGLLSLDEDN